MNPERHNSPDELMDDLLGDFQDEAAGLLQQLTNDLLRLDGLIKTAQNPFDHEDQNGLLNGMFRTAHRLKSLSGMMQLDSVNGLTQKVENVFDSALRGSTALTSDVVDLVFHAIDRLEAMIDLLQDPKGRTVDYADIQSSIERILKQSGTLSAESALPLDIERLKRLADEVDIAPPPAVPSTTPIDESLSHAVDDEDIPSKYLSIFIDESEQTLEELSELLLAADDPELVSKLLTACHRLKGSAASIGLHRISHVAHRMEDLLQDLRSKSQSVESRLTDAMLANVDALRAYVSGLKTGMPDDCLEAPYQLLHSIVHELEIGADRDAQTNMAAAFDWSQVHGLAPAGRLGFTGSVVFEQNLPLATLKGSLLLEKLRQFGELFYSNPTAEELDQLTDLKVLTFGVASECDEAELRAALLLQGVEELSLQPLAATSQFSTQVASADVTPLQHDETHANCKPAEIIEAPAAALAAQEACPPPSTKIQSCEPLEATTPTSAERNTAPLKSKPHETLRVDIERLDQLMSLAGQLVINKSRFSQIGSQLKELSSFKASVQSVSAASDTANRISSVVQDGVVGRGTIDTSLLLSLTTQLGDDLELVRRALGEFSKMRCAVNELAEAVHQLGRVSDRIQSTVMGTRMVPIGPLFTRFKRVVRDLSRDSHKQIDLKICGENTELDKRMIDELSDPLIHLVRNSVDHGIELPDQRLAVGKAAEGTVTLNAFHRGNRVIIQIVDDGRGLDADLIRDKAIAEGLLSKVDAERMTRQQLLQLIWKPGFSTADRVTEISGRGIGMDIVRTTIEQLNGHIDVASEPGQGTRFEIKLPLTMAIVPSLLVVVDGDVFAIPLESILEIVQLSSAELPTVRGRVMARVRDRIISVVELPDLLAWNGSNDRRCEESATKTLIIVGHEGNDIALVVDNLLGEQEIVIKSMEDNFRNIEGIAGASILGDGRVSLILDISALLAIFRRRMNVFENHFANT